MAAIGQLVGLFIYIYSLIILARVLMSWVRVDPHSQVARVIYDLTEPVLAPVRNLLPPAAGLDFSPIIVMIGLQMLGQVLISFFSA